MFCFWLTLQLSTIVFTFFFNCIILVPNAKKKFEDGVSDSSDDEDGSQSGDESDDEDDDQENNDNSDDESSSSHDDNETVNVDGKINIDKNSKDSNLRVYQQGMDGDSSSDDESDDISNKDVKTKVKELKTIQASESESQTSDDDMVKKHKLNFKENAKGKIKNVKNEEAESNFEKGTISNSKKEVNLKRKQLDLDQEHDPTEHTDKKKSKVLDSNSNKLKNVILTSKNEIETNFSEKQKDKRTHKLSESVGKISVKDSQSSMDEKDDNDSKNDKRNLSSAIKSVSNKDDDNSDSHEESVKNDRISESNDEDDKSAEDEMDVDQFKDLRETDESNDELEDCSERIGSFFDFRSNEGDNLKVCTFIPE